MLLDSSLQVLQTSCKTMEAIWKRCKLLLMLKLYT